MSKIIKIAFLLLGAILIAAIVNQVYDHLAHPAVEVIHTQKVRVSTADLPQGLLLRDEDIKWKEIPADKVPPGAVVSGAADAIELKGALLRHPVTAGTVLIGDDVILPSAPGFLAATLKPDMRAVSVAVDDVSGNAGLIQPGDYVDLLLTQQLGDRTSSPAHSVVSETVVQHVRVLASGSEISRPKSGDNSNPDNRRPARTVTLEVTPHMGEVVAVAARLGSLSLALRSFATVSRDPGQVSTLNGPAVAPTLPPPVWSGDISHALIESPPPIAGAPVVPHTVTIYRGSARSDGGDGAVANGGGASLPPLPLSTPH